MTLLLEYTLRISIVLVLALVTTRLLAGRSAGLRHAVLAVAVICAVLLPAMTAVTPWEWGLMH